MTNLQRLLEPRGTSARICQKFGVASGNVSDWKNGRTRPSATVMHTLSEFFGVSLDYLLDLTDDPTPPPKDDTPDLSAGQQKLLDLADGLSDEDFYKVFDYIDLVKARRQIKKEEK
jgi:transcriptional regulator with XRE-family HTH domain